MRKLASVLGRISIRLLAVNLVLVLVPVAGLEFARLYERQLLRSLERDMRNQAVLTRYTVEENLANGSEFSDARHERVLKRAAKRTRTRVRLLDTHGESVADSHVDGPPEGPEHPPSSWFPLIRSNSDARYRSFVDGKQHWPKAAKRREVQRALAGKPSAITRVAHRPAAVFLFVSEPVRGAKGTPIGVVYITRSTTPVLKDMHRIRTGLTVVMAVAALFTVFATLLLAWTISAPLGRLSRAAARIAAGHRDVTVPTSGGGEIGELGESFRAMTEQLDARVQYIGDFAADVAHEFKSPLTSIRGAAELLTEGADDDPAARARFLNNIRLDSERLDRLVTQLLELSRFEASAGDKSPVDLVEVLREGAARAETPDVRVELARAAPVVVRGRVTDLDAALGNLIENAVRFSPNGEVVRLAVGATADEAIIHVDDAGPGVPLEQREQVFQRFFTTDQDRSGTGLGLAIARTVVAAHRGTIEIDESPQGGARFTVRLPRSA